MLTVNMEKITELEAGIVAHYKKFHADRPYGASLYSALNGKNVGIYMRIMGQEVLLKFWRMWKRLQMVKIWKFGISEKILAD